jgi:hypothetical protein
MFDKLCGRVWAGFIWLRIRISGVLCEHRFAISCLRHALDSLAKLTTVSVCGPVILGFLHLTGWSGAVQQESLAAD